MTTLCLDFGRPSGQSAPSGCRERFVAVADGGVTDGSCPRGAGAGTATLQATGDALSVGLMVFFLRQRTADVRWRDGYLTTRKPL